MPCKPRQIEFARLNLTYTLMSKRKLLELVQEKVVRGATPTILAWLFTHGSVWKEPAELCEGVSEAFTLSFVVFRVLLQSKTWLTQHLTWLNGA